LRAPVKGRFPRSLRIVGKRLNPPMSNRSRFSFRKHSPARRFSKGRASHHLSGHSPPGPRLSLRERGERRRRFPFFGKEKVAAKLQGEFGDGRQGKHTKANHFSRLLGGLVLLFYHILHPCPSGFSRIAGQQSPILEHPFSTRDPRSHLSLNGSAEMLNLTL